MKTFKAKHNKSFYKDTDAWINAVYRNNKAVIDKELSGGEKGPKSTFKQIINEYIAEGKSPTKAMSTLARSTIFTPEAERIKNNFWSGLKGDADAYKEFRELSKEKGRYTKFDQSKLKWNKADKAYTYNGVIIISFKNSPLGISVRHI